MAKTAAKAAKKAATKPETKTTSHNSRTKNSAEGSNVSSTLPSSVVRSLPVAEAIMKHVLAVVDLYPQLERELKAAEKGGAISMSRAFVVLHRLRERINTEKDTSAFKPLMKIFERYQKEVIPHIFDVENVPNVNLAEGFRVGVSNPFYASIKKDMKTAAYAWMRDNGLADLIQSTVNSSSLSSALKEKLEEHNIEAPDNIFTAAYVPGATVTKI